MREEIRYRVTGSIFLLALAVICLPMLLDGAGLPARHLQDLPIMETLPDVQPLPTSVPETDFVARVQALREQVDEEGFLTESGTRFGEPVLEEARPRDRVPFGLGDVVREKPAAAPSAAGTWAVQVASFAEVDNAEDFRARLRRDGYEAFISTAKSGDRVLRRVAVGPLLDRQRAESLRGELAARYRVEAQLMALSN